MTLDSDVKVKIIYNVSVGGLVIEKSTIIELPIHIDVA